LQGGAVREGVGEVVELAAAGLEQILAMPGGVRERGFGRKIEQPRWVRANHSICGRGSDSESARIGREATHGERITVLEFVSNQILAGLDLPRGQFMVLSYFPGANSHSVPGPVFKDAMSMTKRCLR
jgi:hypothetical protein